MKHIFVLIILFFFWVIPFAQAAHGEINDPYFFEQWYLEYIGAPALWSLPQPTHRTVVAVLDTGVDIDHPDLREHIWVNNDEIRDNGIDDDKNGYIDDVHGWDFVISSPDPRPKMDDVATDIGLLHGTSVASIIGAVSGNQKGISGVSNTAIIMPLRVLSSDGFGRTVEVVEAIDYALNNGAEVINLSFVGKDNDSALQNIILRAYEKGVTVVVASGNGRENIAAAQNEGVDLNVEPMYPVCYGGKEISDMVIGVGAIDFEGKRASFSNFGSNCVDILAPGIQFFTASVSSFGSKYYRGHFDGTSLATPLVSGVVSFLKAQNPNFSPKEIHSILLENSPNGKLNVKNIAQFITGRRIENSTPSKYPSFSLDGSQNILTVTGSVGGQSTVTLYDALQGGSSNILLYPPSFLHGSSITLGDVNADEFVEIIAAPNPGGGPQIRIFRPDGSLLNQFFAFPESFHGGVEISYLKMNDSTSSGIVVAPKENASPEVRIFDFAGNLVQKFLAYDAEFQKGITIKTADLDNDGNDEIVTLPNPGGGPQLRIFRPDGTVVGQFFVFDETFRGGVEIDFADVNQDGLKEVIVSPRASNEPQVRVFDLKGNLLSNFLAYNSSYRNGFSITVSDITGDDIPEIVTSPNFGGGPQIRVFTPDGSLVNQFFAFEETLRTGINVKVFDLGSDGKKEFAITPKTGIIPRLRMFDTEGRLFVSSLLSTLGRSE